MITGVKFVGTTHHFFTVGKDKLVKQWDGDKFEPIMTLEVCFLVKTEVVLLTVLP